MATGRRTYNDAIDALNSLQTPHEVIEARRKAGVRPDAASMEEMRVYLARIGYYPGDLDRLNIIHVAGTKGKGSTCAFVDSILSKYRQTHQVPRKSGLFISPHLIAVRERIRINSAPISEELFAKYFFEVWDRLAESTTAANVVPLGTRPLYGRYLTLMSWHAFIQEGVDVAVYETGIGGEYDATNVVEQPIASGISTLGIDHVFVLGDTVEKIAWHKAGIMKIGSPAFTVEQVPGAAAVLQERAKEKEVDLKVLDIDSRLRNVKIKPNAQFQKKNATLAIALAEAALKKLGVDTTGDRICLRSLSTGWSRRCSEVAARQSEDVIAVVRRRDRQSARPSRHDLQPARPLRSRRLPLLGAQRDAARGERPILDHVVFCTNVTYAKTGYKRDFVNHQIDPKEIENMTVQRRFADKWSELDPEAKVVVLPTIEEALDYARHVGEGLGPGEQVQAYVTGSLHLNVGLQGSQDTTHKMQTARD
ncbi:hypothetical protein ACCO45_006901 [Purpureocillium lilacinum]|uniref:Uncharacterized protein n=1 Tax=Purpureocillium lilacinum TaxID=33203 RepID=A0ACC4DT54_PURLI